MLVELNEEEYEVLKKILREAEEPDYMNGEFSYWDRRRMEQGRAPVWAKSMKNIGPRPKQLRHSSAPSEVAMRKVTNPNEKKPYTSADWEMDKEARKESNQKIANELKLLLPSSVKEVTADSNEVSILCGKYVFRVEARGPRYRVLRFNPDSVLDRKSEICRSLKQVVDFISNNEE